MKAFTLVLFFFTIATVFAQNLEYDCGEVEYPPVLQKPWYTRITDSSALEPGTQQLLYTQLLNSTGLQLKNLEFVLCDKYNLVEYLTAHPDSLNKYQLPIPRYFAVFSWQNSTLGIKRYNIMIMLDQYGQITYLNLPHGYRSGVDNLIPLDSAQMLAHSYSINDTINYSGNELYVGYDMNYNDLIYQFSYFSDITKLGVYKTSLIRVITISASRRKVINDHLEKDLIYFRF